MGRMDVTTPHLRSPSHLASLDDRVSDQLLRDRIVVLGQAVDDEVANRLCAQLLLLAAEDPTRDVALYINSPGGSVYSGLAVFDTMESIACDVATYVFGLAASMGQFLLTAGTPGKRFALPRSRVLMHQPSGGIGGTATDIAIQATQVRELKAEIAQMARRFTSHAGVRASRPSPATPIATVGSPRSRRSTTASSTGSSPGPPSRNTQ